VLSSAYIAPPDRRSGLEVRAFPVDEQVRISVDLAFHIPAGCTRARCHLVAGDLVDQGDDIFARRPGTLARAVEDGARRLLVRRLPERSASGAARCGASVIVVGDGQQLDCRAVPFADPDPRERVEVLCGTGAGWLCRHRRCLGKAPSRIARKTLRARSWLG
jgi:hypothetical protein